MEKPYTVLLRLETPLHWCYHCNVPVLSRKCSLCGRDTLRLRVTPPGDIYPVLYDDQVKEIRHTLVEYFKSKEDSEKFLSSSKLIFLNKVSNVDAANEMIVDGQLIGQIIFDPLRKTWRFKPLLYGVARIIEEKIGYYAIVDLPKIARRFTIRRSYIVEKNLPEIKGEFVALQTKNGKFQGVGEILRGKRIRVLKSWRSKKYIGGSAEPTFRDVIEANLDRLLMLEKSSINLLRSLRRKYLEKPIFVSFSGGKDSLVTLNLALDALGNVPVLFNDTGLELPGTREYVEKLSQELGLKLIIADADDAFRSSFKIFGPPARDYRWCCKVIKLAPISRVVNKLFPRGAISIVGVRRYESSARARSPRVWVNKWLPKLISASPIMDWTALDVWMYIFMKKLKVNPMYSMGFNRLGCWLCPACNVADFIKVENKFPRMWALWESELAKWYMHKKLNNIFKELELWRWRKIPGNVIMFLRKHGFNIRISKIYRGLDLKLSIKEIKYKGNKAFVKGSLKVNKRLFMMLVTLGEISTLKDSTITILSTNEDFTITIKRDGEFTLRAQQNILRNSLKLLVGVYLRSTSCVKCGLCVQTCSGSNISISNEGVLIGKNCSHCNLCNNLCPLVEYIAVDYVDYIISKFQSSISGD